METNLQQRLRSLDALRGFDMFWILGGGKIFITLAAITGTPVLGWWAGQMEHTQWAGCTFYDMIFPLFLFIAGISFPFSVAKSVQKGLSRKAIHLRVVRRGFVLVLLGMIYNGLLAFDFSTIRYASVLGRIGLAWMFAALIFMNTKRLSTRVIWCAGCLIFYWLLLTFVSAPDSSGAARFSMEGNFTSYIDRLFLPGRLHLGIHDPEGLLGIIPAIATAMLGMFTGEFVRRRKDGLSETKKCGYMAIAGVALILIGQVWNIIFPINKNLWSSSFVCFVGGISLLLFCLFYFIIDVRKYQKWSFFFAIIGLNSITIYLGQRIIDFHYTTKFLFGGILGCFPDIWSAFLGATAYIGVCWCFLYFLYKQKIFLKV
ncbi:MAG: DUF5009 domain-containing protein [Tannerella sp.]|jgi:predicted acyltransferase|nr:DUF5009 domain-containing protein [Tannerella sp.]